MNVKSVDSGYLQMKTASLSFNKLFSANYVLGTPDTINNTKRNLYPCGVNILEGASTKRSREEVEIVLTTHEAQEYKGPGPALLSTSWLLETAGCISALYK